MILNVNSQAYQDDPLPNRILMAIREGNSLKDITVAECTEPDGYVEYRGKRYVRDNAPLKLRLIEEHHDTALAGHPGRVKMLDLLD